MRDEVNLTQNTGGGCCLRLKVAGMCPVQGGTSTNMLQVEELPSAKQHTDLADSY